MSRSARFTSTASGVFKPWNRRAVFALLGFIFIGQASVFAQNAPTTAPTTAPVAPAAPPESLFRDPVDGAFDISGFLATSGFLPLAIPITEPAVGYGVGGGLAFFHGTPKVVQTPDGPRVIPPSISMVGGMGTDNGTWGAFAGHLQVWNDGRIRYLVGGGYASLNLNWYGTGDAFGGRSFAYNQKAVGVFQKLTFKVGASDFYIGPTQRLLSTNASFDLPDKIVGIVPNQRDATTSGIGVTFSYDTRNSLFSPTRGTKANLTYSQQADWLGGDFNYARINAEYFHYIPLGGPFTLGLRAEGDYVSNDAPFFDLSAISLRGIEPRRYVDNLAVSLEAELRYDMTTRWTLVGFGGVGWFGDQPNNLFSNSTQLAGGAGVRYLIARQLDMRMGIDIARSADDWAFYVTVGTGWARD